MSTLNPSTAEDLAERLKEAGAESRSVTLLGNNSKRLMAGPRRESELVLSTSRLRRVLQYEPNDLTVSVESGLPWAELRALLAQKRQLVALDPPFWSRATVGGVVATNASGPMRKAYGTARDLIIGMQFAMLDGKLIRTGGMVVKNVAGLDMGKLMIGSFGTLGAITSVNFRLHAMPEETDTFLYSFGELEAALAQRNQILESFLRPMALDLLSPAAATRFGRRGYLLAVRAGGSRRVLDRYARDLAGSERLKGNDDEALWEQIREFPADFMSRQPGGLVVRLSTPLSEIGDLLRSVTDASVSRAGSGVTYVCLSSSHSLKSLWELSAKSGWAAVLEYASDDVRATRDLWLGLHGNTSDFDMMKGVKHMFDPDNLLNRSRLYGRI